MLTAEQKALLERENTSIAQQETMIIKGNDQRNMLMHKLMRKNQSQVIVLRLVQITLTEITRVAYTDDILLPLCRNMVTADDVDEQLQDEITEECGKYGRVEQVLIAQERLSERANDVNVKGRIA